MNTYSTPLVIISICSIWIGSFLPISIRAQGNAKVDFYCDRNERGEPVTVIRRYDSPSKIEIIVWRKNPKTAADRCENISRKMRAMWERGDFNYLGNGSDSNGRGLICALSYKQRTCDRTNLLFTVNNFKESQEIIDETRKRAGGKPPRPIEQSGGGLLEIDMQDLVKALSAPSK